MMQSIFISTLVEYDLDIDTISLIFRLCLTRIILMKRDTIKGERGLLGGAFGKYLPTPEAHQLILNYFRYNNFQDFNTWQQIAKTKLDYDYTEIPVGF